MNDPVTTLLVEALICADTLPPDPAPLVDAAPAALGMEGPGWWAQFRALILAMAEAHDPPCSP